MREMSKFLAVGGNFFPSPGFPIKFQGKGGQSTPCECNNFVTILVRREMPDVWFWEIILLEQFCIKGLTLVLIELFQISQWCDWMRTAGKTFSKTYLKAIRDTFFLSMWNFPICNIFFQQMGKVYTFRLAGRPSPLPSSLACWNILSSPWEKPWGWLACLP